MRRIWDTNAPDPETPVARGQRAGRSRRKACETSRPPLPLRTPNTPAGRAPWWSGRYDFIPTLWKVKMKFLR